LGGKNNPRAKGKARARQEGEGLEFITQKGDSRRRIFPFLRKKKVIRRASGIFAGERNGVKPQRHSSYSDEVRKALSKSLGKRL